MSSKCKYKDPIDGSSCTRDKSSPYHKTAKRYWFAFTEDAPF